MIFVVRSEEGGLKEYGLKSKQFRRTYSKAVHRLTSMHCGGSDYRKQIETGWRQVKSRCRHDCLRDGVENVCTCCIIISVFILTVFSAEASNSTDTAPFFLSFFLTTIFQLHTLFNVGWDACWWWTGKNTTRNDRRMLSNNEQFWVVGHLTNPVH